MIRRPSPKLEVATDDGARTVSLRAKNEDARDPAGLFWGARLKLFGGRGPRLIGGTFRRLIQSS